MHVIGTADEGAVDTAPEIVGPTLMATLQSCGIILITTRDQTVIVDIALLLRDTDFFVKSSDCVINPVIVIGIVMAKMVTTGKLLHRVSSSSLGLPVTFETFATFFSVRTIRAKRISTAHVMHQDTVFGSTFVSST